MAGAHSKSEWLTLLNARDEAFSAKRARSKRIETAFAPLSLESIVLREALRWQAAASAQLPIHSLSSERPTRAAMKRTAKGY